MKQPHVHAKLIKQWADGAIIQYYNSATEAWEDIFKNRPLWMDDAKYRVKPKPTAKYFAYIPLDNRWLEISEFEYENKAYAWMISITIEEGDNKICPKQKAFKVNL